MKKLTLLLFSFLLVSCAAQEKTRTFSGIAMTMHYKIMAGNGSTDTEIQKIIDDTFKEINSIYNKWNPSSELSKLNRLKKGQKVKISEKLHTFLKETDKVVHLSEGKFDPTIEPIQKLWKEKLKQRITPSTTEIEQKMHAVGWDKVHFQDGIFYKDHDETSLDLGGIAKGYAIDLLVSNINAAGIKDVFVEWGGEIKATGQHPDNRPWHIFISKLQDSDPDHAIAHLDLQTQAIATSGDYLQNWTIKENGKLKTYFHIFDSKTGYPLEITKSTIASTSVVADSCMIADAIATVLMLFQDKAEAIEWGEKMRQEYPEMQFWIISRSQD